VGLLVPIDLDGVDLDATVDVEDRSLQIRATARFAAGATAGRSVFQLLRTPEEVVLDGTTIAVDDLTRVVVSDPPRSLVLLPGELEPCSEHTLEVAYVVRSEDVEPAPLSRLRFDGVGGAWWASAQEDGEPDSMLEVWMPSNLLFDRFPIDLSLAVVGTDAPHDLAANADVDGGDGAWSVSFPSRQPHGSFWVLYPSEEVEQVVRPVDLPGGRVVDLDLRRFAWDDGVDLAASADVAEEALRQYDDLLGEYLHGDVYLAWLRSDLPVSMEYEGATLSVPGALKHEMAHSWWARGVAPVSDHHGWMDEGVALWATGAQPFLATPVPVNSAGVRLLVGEDDWSAPTLGPQHYVQGAIVFAGIADRVGQTRLLEVLARFLEEEGPTAIDTGDLERLLYCEFRQTYVLDMFHTKVRGLEPPAAEPSAGYCDEE